ncbi:uncharacterized protein LOC129226358, partial [Uloborus diversus]|uniref:uncharacterized protein LOC129226358 n=1 Tax=Uloborus diversus TaxID=327109 RepID=UPI00240A0487
ITEDSNNNTSLIDHEQVVDASTNTGDNVQQSPCIREIHKNSWLKKMPCADRWSGRFPKSQRPEKFWVVFCVHDDKEAFLEFYENRRSAYSHMPLSNISLAKCLHISPTIVAQENDHEFVITLETQVIRLAASTNDQMLEWMDTMRTKLRELGILEPKDNLYSKEPITSSKTAASSVGETHVSELQMRDDFSRMSLRDPNSPLPPVPASAALQLELRDSSVPSSTVVYIRNPPILRSSNHPSSSSTSPSALSELSADVYLTFPVSSTPCPENIFNFDVSDTEQTTYQRSRSNSLVSQNSSPASSPNVIEERISSVPSTPSIEQPSLYEPLFYSCVSNVSLGIRNPNYENPPQPARRMSSNSAPALPPRSANDQRRMSSSIANDIQNMHSGSSVATSGLSNLASTSDPSLNISSGSSRAPESPTHNSASSSAVLVRTQSQLESVRNVPERNGHLPSDEGPPPYNGIEQPLRSSQPGNLLSNGVLVDANGKPLSLREVQVQKLQSEILHKSGVRLVLRKKDCINAIALVECFNLVWVAGWKQKEHPFLHNTFHVGDRVISIAGHRILSVQDAHKAIKHQSSIVEFVVRRVPCGKVLAIKRDFEGQDLGIIREGGSAEIKELKQNGLVARHGLPSKAPTMDGSSLCNWVFTEINHRPLNLFFKDNEVHDRLNAVGLDISILVQPLDLVKALKKQLKTFRSYKDYIVQ